MNDAIEVCEVGPRDGLQNESQVLPPAVRAELCDRLVNAGVWRLEAVSFVNSERVPQMARAEAVLRSARTRPRARYAGLVLNGRGYERAIDSGVDEIRFALPATDAFGKHNQGLTSADAMELARELIRQARLDGVAFSVTVAVAFGCPFDGRVDPGWVRELVGELVDIGVDEIVLADTIGVAVPAQVTDLVRPIENLGTPVGAHFHNTRNTGYANAFAAL